MLPLLQREIVDKRKWATEEEILNYFAIGQCTPGVIAVNTSTFIGYKQRKVPGAIFATLGVVTPSFIIILLIAMLFRSFADNVYVMHAFKGIRIAAGALILSSVIRLMKKNVRSVFQIALCVIAFVIVAVLGFSPVWVVVGAGLFGFAAGKVGKAV